MSTGHSIMPLILEIGGFLIAALIILLPIAVVLLL